METQIETWESPEPILPSSFTRRSICQKCDRPSTVCICSALPETLIPTATKIITIQHPHQLRNPLCTVPILSKSLQNATVVVARRLRLGLCPFLDSLYHTHHSPAMARVAYLFPPTKTHPSTPLSSLRISSGNQQQQLFEVLIAFDGTWSHAREMVAASEEFLSKFAVRICLDCDKRVEGKTIYDSELILRKEPFEGCVSTAEAVARILGVIEPGGFEVENILVRILGQMVASQKRFIKPVDRRPKSNEKGLTRNDHKQHQPCNLHPS